MNTYAFDVGLTTHAALQCGVVTMQHARVEVAADSYDKAVEVAIQMGFCVGYATSCEYVE